MLDDKWMVFVYTDEAIDRITLEDSLMLIRYDGSRLFDTKKKAKAEARKLLHGLKARNQRTGWRAAYVHVWTRQHPVEDCRVRFIRIEDL